MKVSKLYEMPRAQPKRSKAIWDRHPGAFEQLKHVLDADDLLSTDPESAIISITPQETDNGKLYVLFPEPNREYDENVTILGLRWSEYLSGRGGDWAYFSPEWLQKQGGTGLQEMPRPASKPIYREVTLNWDLYYELRAALVDWLDGKPNDDSMVEHAIEILGQDQVYTGERSFRLPADPWTVKMMHEALEQRRERSLEWQEQEIIDDAEDENSDETYHAIDKAHDEVHAKFDEINMKVFDED